MKTTDNVLTPPAHGQIWPGQGGIYICALAALLGTPARHLIAAAEDGPRLTYGPYNDVPGTDSHVDGAANTKFLLAADSDHTAAKWAANYTTDGHADFFLPARLDLVMAHICAREHFSKSGWYWSSTQGSRYYAFVQDFEDGGSSWGSKDFGRRVRAFRAIHLTT